MRDRRVAAYRRSRRWRARWRVGAEALFDGWWLGMLDGEHLREVDQEFYATATEDVDGVKRSYAERDHITSGLSAWEREAVAGFPAGGTVLVTSAGAGREVLGLIALGFDARGFEPNPMLVAAGQAVIDDPTRLTRCEYDAFPAHHGRADAVVIGWGAYMLVRGREARIELLRGAAAALDPGGLLLVSYFDRPATRYFAVVRGVGNALRRVRRTHPLELGDALSPNFVHFFSPSEVRSELDAAGFDVGRQVRAPYGHTLATRR